MREDRSQKKNRWKKFLFMWCMGVGMLGLSKLSVFAAEQTGSFEGHPLFESSPCSGVVIEDSNESVAPRRGSIGGNRYDPRENHMVANHMEDQGETNTCWAFSTIAAIESNLIKKGYEGEDVNLSENHLAYYFYNRQNDPLGNTPQDRNWNTLTSDWAQNGGTLQGTALHLATWSGVIRETVPEDNAGGWYQPGVPAAPCYQSDYRVANTYFYNYSVENVKQAISDYGAVASGIYMDERYWNMQNGAYYCPQVNGNHAVAIVGWDDSYDRNNFVVRPRNNGAWIVKNSYGTQREDGTPLGDNGYMYVSYEDASLSEIVAYDMIPATQSYAHNYQYDGTGDPAEYWNFPNGSSYAVAFQAKGSPEGYNELLKAVSVEVLTTNVSYSVQIYTGLTGTTDPQNGQPALASPQMGVLKEAGYNQIVLNTPVSLTAGERYAVVISLSSSNNTPVRMGCEATMDANWIRFVAGVEAGQSYVNRGGKWYDFGSIADVGTGNISNLRIKAYTDDTTEKTSYALSQTKLALSKGSSAKLSMKITPESVRREILWSSSNARVATVSDSGRVKGKKYGTATIHAKLTVGETVKDFTCKVTVGPKKLQNFKVKGGKNKITVTWGKNTAADGYVIYYSTDPNGNYKKLGTVTKKKKNRFVKKHISAGTYYVKAQPYVKKKGKKLYGSETAVKRVTVR